jgi:hypothetical protein
MTFADLPLGSFFMTKQSNILRFKNGENSCIPLTNGIVQYKHLEEWWRQYRDDEMIQLQPNFTYEKTTVQTVEYKIGQTT